MAWGTLAVPDLVRSSQQNILDFGEENLFQYTQQRLDAYNAITREQMALFASPTNERIMGYGGSTGIVMVKANEFGRADASKPAEGGNIGLPLELNQISVQWTRKWFQNHTPAEFMNIVDDAMLVDTQTRQIEIKNALFRSTNRAFVDKLIDRYSLSVKALANADSFALPPDPYGNAVDGATHNHYLARVSTLAASDIDAVVNTVAEHYNTGKVILLINSAQTAAIQAFNAAGQFVQNQPVEFRLANTTTFGGNLDTTQTNNRMIGYWGSQAAEVWVKPWIPANYMLALITGVGKKVLAYRTRRGNDGGLAIAADDEAYPLRAQTMEAEYGFGVQDRLGAAVLYTGGTVYVDPTF